MLILESYHIPGDNTWQYDWVLLVKLGISDTDIILYIYYYPCKKSNDIWNTIQMCLGNSNQQYYSIT